MDEAKLKEIRNLGPPFIENESNATAKQKQSKPSLPSLNSHPSTKNKDPLVCIEEGGQQEKGRVWKLN